MPGRLATRVFKTAWFGKASKKAGIHDSALCTGIEQSVQGQVDDLGGGVFKKRLNVNIHRAIILAKSERLWIYSYLFAKKDRGNIESDELVQFRELAKAYGKLKDRQIDQMIDSRQFVEICHDSEN